MRGGRTVRLALAIGLAGKPAPQVGVPRGAGTHGDHGRREGASPCQLQQTPPPTHQRCRLLKPAHRGGRQKGRSNGGGEQPLGRNSHGTHTRAMAGGEVAGVSRRRGATNAGVRVGELSMVAIFLTAIPRLEAPYFHIAVRKNEWGNRLLQFYRVNWSILLYSREICCGSFSHAPSAAFIGIGSTVHSIHPILVRPAAVTRGPAWCSGKPLNQPT